MDESGAACLTHAPPALHDEHRAVLRGGYPLSATAPKHGPYGAVQIAQRAQICYAPVAEERLHAGQVRALGLRFGV